MRVAATIAALAVPYAMWNGAVFMPLIEEIDTIEPGRPAPRFRGDGLAHEEHRLEILGEQRAPVAPGHAGGGHPGRRRGTASDVDEPVEVALVRVRLLQHRREPSSVEASAATGTTESPDATSGAICRSRFPGAAHRDHGRARSATMPDGGANAAASGAGHHDDAAVEAQEIVPWIRTGIHHLSVQHIVTLLNGEHYSAAVISSSRVSKLGP